MQTAADQDDDITNHPVFTSKNRGSITTKESLRDWQTLGSSHIQFFLHGRRCAPQTVQEDLKCLPS
jgi:hypothetical protein